MVDCPWIGAPSRQVRPVKSRAYVGTANAPVRGMKRIILALFIVAAMAAPASARARKGKRVHRPSAAPVQTVEKDKAILPPKVDNASEYEKAKAQLADLNTIQQDTPIEFLHNQTDDKENPLKK